MSKKKLQKKVGQKNSIGSSLRHGVVADSNRKFTFAPIIGIDMKTGVKLVTPKIALEKSSERTRSFNTLKAVSLPGYRSKRSRLLSTYEKLNLNEMLDISSLVDSGIKGLPMEGKKNELETAQYIVGLYNNERSRGHAECLIADLNHKIVTENSKGLNKAAGKRLLNNLMK